MLENIWSERIVDRKIDGKNKKVIIDKKGNTKNNNLCKPMTRL